MFITFEIGIYMIKSIPNFFFVALSALSIGLDIYLLIKGCIGTK